MLCLEWALIQEKTYLMLEPVVNPRQIFLKITRNLSPSTRALICWKFSSPQNKSKDLEYLTSWWQTLRILLQQLIEAECLTSVLVWWFSLCCFESWSNMTSERLPLWSHMFRWLQQQKNHQSYKNSKISFWHDKKRRLWPWALTLNCKQN